MLKRAILLGPALKQTRQQFRFVKEFLKQLPISASDFLIGIDGGVPFWFELGYSPNLGVGDWDSLGESQSCLDAVPHWSLPQEKNHSDLFFAVVAAIESGMEEIICLGVTGGRADHHLAVLLDLSRFAAGEFGLLKSIQAIGLDGRYIFLSSQIPSWQSRVELGQWVSLFALNARVTGVTLKGFQYLLEGADLEPSSLGLSNQVLMQDCEVKIQQGNLLILIPSIGNE